MLMLSAELRQTKIYDERDYWEQMSRDVLNAKASVIIYSPFATIRGTSKWDPLINKLIASGRRVHIITANTRERGHQIDILDTPAAEARRKQIQLVLEWIARVTPFYELRDNVHPKFVIIDEVILWEGSMNYLSHFDTREHLRRTVSSEDVKEVMMRHDINAPSASLDEAIQEVGAMIKDQREERGLSQREAAERLGVNASQWSRIEKGTLSAFNATFQRMLNMLDLRVVVVPSYLYEITMRFVRDRHVGK